jgi:phage-related protein
VSFYFDGGWDENKIRQVSRWLFQDYYKPLSFSDNPDRIFYAMVDSDSSLIHNGLSEGYVTLSFRCDSPYAYSPVYTTEIFDLTSTTSLQLTNEGDANLYPEIWIQTTVAGDVTITNLTNGGATTEFTDLASNETVYLNSETEDIATDIAGLYRYDNFNNTPLVLVPGINNLTITGKVKVQFRYQYKVLQG